MPRARILINGNPASLLDAPVGAVVQLDNDGLGDESTYLWTIIDQPEGAADSLSDPTIQNPTFISSKEGTYLVRLVVDYGLGTEVQDQKIAAVLQVKSWQRIPAAQETTEADATAGWTRAVNRMLRLADNRLANPGCIVAQVSSAMNRGQPVYINSTATLKSGLPWEETIPTVGKALGNTLVRLVATCGIVEGRIDGNAAVGLGEAAIVRIIGLIGPFTGPLVLADLVYISDAGGLANTPGTYPRCIGRVVADAAGDYYVFVDGAGYPGCMIHPDPAKQDAPAILSWGNGSTPAAPGVTYLDPWWRKPVTSADEVLLTVPYDGTLSRLYVRALTAPVGDTATFTVRVNAADTTITVVLTPPDRGGNDTAHSVQVSAGDEVSMSLSLGAAIAAGPTLFTATLALARR